MIEATCHCGAVRMEIARPPEEVTDCNCSICRRLGVLWAYYPLAEVSFAEGTGATGAYSWGERTIAFHHCRTCGCPTHWIPVDETKTDRMGVNARLMDPEILQGARIRELDGASWKVPTRPGE